MKHLLPSLACCLLVTLLGCQSHDKVVLQGLVQGSYYAVTYFDDEGRDLQVGIDSIFALVDESVSLWNPNSIISKVNRNEAVTLNQVFIDNFNIAQEASRISDGYFDATVSPLVAAWGFSYKNGDSITPELIDSLCRLVDYRKIRIVNDSVVKDDSRISLDFNAIAQGYTSDMIAAYLKSQGVDNYLVDVGGEIKAGGGKPHDKNWIVGVEKPSENADSERIVQTRVVLKDKGLVTSGSYRKYVERNGHRFSHCINPKTGYPVEHNLLSATVLAETSVKADALASICMIMGLEKSLELINSMDGVEAYYIFEDADGNLRDYATEGFKMLIVE